MAAARRILAVVLVGAAVVGAWRLDQQRPDAVAAVFGAAEVPLVPQAPRPSALSSTWYCPGTPAPADAPGGQVAVLNAGDVDLSGTFTAFPLGGAPVVQPLAVGAGARVVVALGAVAPSELTGALVEIIGGSVVVEQVDDQGAALVCSSTASTSWFLADGDTRVANAQQQPVNAGMQLSVLNPFDADAVLDFGFATAEGFTTRQDLEGFVVPARSVARISLDDRIRRTSRIGVVATTRTGRVVLAGTQTYDGVLGRGSVTTLAVPRTAASWWFADGRKGDGVQQRLSVFNPGEDDVVVLVEVRLDDIAAPPVEPIQLTVPPQGSAVLDLSAEEVVPAGGFSIDLVADGGPVAAQLTTAFGDPADRRGVQTATGAPVSAGSWLLPTPVGVGAGSGRDELRLSNPTGAEVVVDVRSLVPGGSDLPLSGASGVVLAPGASTTVDLLAPQRSSAVDLPLAVTASGPVVVQRSRATPVTEGTGAATTALGIPVLDS